MLPYIVGPRFEQGNVYTSDIHRIKKIFLDLNYYRFQVFKNLIIAGLEIQVKLESNGQLRAI